MSQENNSVPELSELLQIRRDKLTELVNEGKNPFEQVKFDKTHYCADIENNFESMEGEVVSVAGRLMSKRGMGKVMFCDLQDVSGKIQLFVKLDVLGEASYAAYKKLDIGDIVGAKGEVFKTKTGQVSVRVSEYTLLSKSLLPLPEKFHGMTDTDLRYRQRYVDLIMNERSRQTFLKRTQIIKEIRNFLDNLGFMEVETPVLHTIPGGAAARPFITYHNTLDIDLYMRIALELHLKRLIVGGFEKVYEIGRVFRNEGMDTKHNPEFTLLELYEAYTDYEHIMNLTEDLYRYVAQAVLGTGVVEYDGATLDFSKPFERISMVDAVKKYAGVDFNEIETLEEARKVAKEHHIQFEPHHLKGDILNLFFDEFVEDKLVQPTFLTGHPVEISPLAKKCPGDSQYTERFELFICGRECANAFSELNDPIDQKERFMAQVAKRDAGDDEASMMDDDFVTALEYGMPPTGGLGIGIDRLVMILTGENSIRDVLLFPTMKPLDK